jgi:hypothetical protein
MDTACVECSPSQYYGVRVGKGGVGIGAAVKSLERVTQHLCDCFEVSRRCNTLGEEGLRCPKYPYAICTPVSCDWLRTGRGDMCGNWQHRTLRTTVRNSSAMGKKLVLLQDGVEGDVVGELSSVYATTTSALLAKALQMRDENGDACLVGLRNGQFAVRNDVDDGHPMYANSVRRGTCSPGWKANTTCQRSCANCILVESSRRTSDTGRELYVLLVLTRSVPEGADLVVMYPLPDGVPCKCGAEGCIGPAEAADWVSSRISELFEEEDLPAMACDRAAYRRFKDTLLPFKEKFRSLGVADCRPFDGITKCDMLSRVFEVGAEEVRCTLELSDLLRGCRRELHESMGWARWASWGEIATSLSKAADLDEAVGAVRLLVDAVTPVLEEARGRGLDGGGFLSVAVGACVAGYVGALRSAGASLGRPMGRKVRGLSHVVANECRAALGLAEVLVDEEDLSLWKAALAWGGCGSFIPPGKHEASREDVVAISKLGAQGLACAVRLQMWSSGRKYFGGLGGDPSRTPALTLGDV